MERFKRYAAYLVLVVLFAVVGTAVAQRYELTESPGGDKRVVQQLIFSNAGTVQTRSDTLIGDADLDTTRAVSVFGADLVSAFFDVRWMDTNDADSLYIRIAFSSDNSLWTAFTAIDTVLGTNDLSNTYHAFTLWPPGPVTATSDTVAATAAQGTMVTTNTRLTPAHHLAIAGYDPTSFPYMRFEIRTGTDEAATDSLNVGGYLNSLYRVKRGY
jgi:hypothetical protein